MYCRFLVTSNTHIPTIYIAIQLIETVYIGHTNSFSNTLFLNYLSTLICFEKEKKKKRDCEMTRVCLENEAQ